LTSNEFIYNFVWLSFLSWVFQSSLVLPLYVS